MFSIRLGVATLGQFIGAQVSKKVTQTGFRNGLHRFIKSMEERVRHQDKARHVLRADAGIQTNEDLRLTVLCYLSKLGDMPWEIANSQEKILPIEAFFQTETPTDGQHTDSEK